MEGIHIPKEKGETSVKPNNKEKRKRSLVKTIVIENSHRHDLLPESKVIIREEGNQNQDPGSQLVFYNPKQG